MDSAPLPDAANDNWVDRFAPRGLRRWLKLGRFDRPAGAWLLLLPGWQGIALASARAGLLPDLVLLAKFLVGAFLMRAAGCAWNDILDRDLDAKVARTARRPVASGEIGVKQALLFMALCSLVSFAILLTMPPAAIGLGVLSLLLVAAYPLMKRITWWPQAWLGLTFNWGALLGYAAATGELALPPVLLYVSGLFWTLGYDTIYAIQDMEDDALAGVKSSARRLGPGAPRAILGFYGVTALLAFAAAYTAHLGPLFIPFGVVYALHLFRQAVLVRMDSPSVALRLFKSNRTAGLILFFGLIAGFWRPG
ncbi:MAG TPA: 4-hydroxybenzoate octaprenyltransferase [Caulobacteraceae bacterium]|jgi:4-hydroxybenzoate polyprenyltransferase